MRNRLRPLLFLLLLLPLCLQAQEEEHILIVDDEECGCELYFVDSIQTTRRNGLFGFKLSDGRDLFPAQYKYVDQWHGNWCKAYIDEEHCGLLDRQGREVVPCLYQSVAYPSDGMVKVNLDGLTGFYTTEGQLAIPPSLYSASIFSEGLAVVVTLDTLDDGALLPHYSYIDHQGNTVLRGSWEYAYPFFNGYAVVKNYGRYTLIDHQGHEMLPCKYEMITAVDNYGNFLANDPNYYPEDESQAPARTALYSTRDFQPITTFDYAFLNFGEGLYVYQRDSLQGYMDTLGREVLGHWEEAAPFQKGYAMVKSNGRYGIIDHEGHIVVPIEYEMSPYCTDCYLFRDGLALVYRDGHFGFCDESGTLVIPLQYERAMHFSSQRAPVRLNGLWGYIDTEGQFVVPPIFHAASPFEYGRADVYYLGHSSKINPQGQCIKACEGFPEF